MGTVGTTEGASSYAKQNFAFTPTQAQPTPSRVLFGGEGLIWGTAVCARDGNQAHSRAARKGRSRLAGEWWTA
jgi:hypothetical protein